MSCFCRSPPLMVWGMWSIPKSPKKGGITGQFKNCVTEWYRDLQKKNTRCHLLGWDSFFVTKNPPNLHNLKCSIDYTTLPHSYTKLGYQLFKMWHGVRSSHPSAVGLQWNRRNLVWIQQYKSYKLKKKSFFHCVWLQMKHRHPWKVKLTDLTD